MSDQESDEREAFEVPEGAPEGFGYHVGLVAYVFIHAVVIGVALGLCAASAVVTYRWLLS